MRVRFDLGPEVFDAHAKSAAIPEVIGAPHLLEQLTLRDDEARMSRQAFEQSILERREMNFSVWSSRQATRDVDLNVSKLEDMAHVASARDAPQCGANAGEQLRCAERLRHIIIGARIESRDLLVLRRACRQD